MRIKHDSLAEWSKALASGASPQGRGFEPHSCHLLSPQTFTCALGQMSLRPGGMQPPWGKEVVPRGLEPRTLRLLAVRSNQLSYETIE